MAQTQAMRPVKRAQRRDRENVSIAVESAFMICLRAIWRKYIIFKSIVNLFSRYNLQCFVQPFVRFYTLQQPKNIPHVCGRAGAGEANVSERVRLVPCGIEWFDWNQFEKKSFLTQFSYELDEIASREYLIDLIYLICMGQKIHGTKIWCGNINGSPISMLFNPFAYAIIIIIVTTTAAVIYI